MTVIRDAVETDFTRIIELNDAEVAQTSPMDLDRLRMLVNASAYCKVATLENRTVAFLICLESTATYENDNFNWFQARFPRFLYVDRIVVSAECAGLGIGSALYAGMFDHARADAIDVITCEYNIEPPNEASRAFHQRFGFKEVGTQWVANGEKKVSLQAAET